MLSAFGEPPDFRVRKLAERPGGQRAAARRRRRAPNSAARRAAAGVGAAWGRGQRRDKTGGILSTARPSGSHALPAPAPFLYCADLAPAEGHPSGSLGPRRGGRRRACPAPAGRGCPPRSSWARRPPPRSALCVAAPPSRRRDVAVCALNMWALPGGLRDAARPTRSGSPRACVCSIRSRWTGSSGSGCRRRSACSTAFADPGADQPVRAGAGVVPLAVVLRAARERRLRAACATGRAVRRPRRRGCTRCSTSARSSTGRSRPPRRGGRPREACLGEDEPVRGAADDDRVRRAVLG